MASTLSELFESFVDTTNQLVERFDVPVPTQKPFDSTCPKIHEDGQALLVVKLQNTWASFCRELIAISASKSRCRVRSAVASVVCSMGFTSPVWHSPEFVVRVAKQLSLANVDRIELYYTANTSSGYVTSVRNYVVHPGSRTESKYREVAAAMGFPSAEVGELLNVRFTGGATLFERWVRELQQTANYTTA